MNWIAWITAVVIGISSSFPHAQNLDAQFPATFSILGYDPDTGEVGGAVQSRVFSVGNGVLWAEADVGVVATRDSSADSAPVVQDLRSGPA